MPAAFLDAFERNLDNMVRRYASDRPDSFPRIPLDPVVLLGDLLISKPRICFYEWHQRSFPVPHGKGVIGIKIGPTPMTALGIDQYPVGGEWVRFPFPPVPAPPAAAIRAILTFEHHAFAKEFARPLTEIRYVAPTVENHRFRQ